MYWSFEKKTQRNYKLLASKFRNKGRIDSILGLKYYSIWDIVFNSMVFLMVRSHRRPEYPDLPDRQIPRPSSTWRSTRPLPDLYSINSRPFPTLSDYFPTHIPTSTRPLLDLYSTFPTPSRCLPDQHDHPDLYATSTRPLPDLYPISDRVQVELIEYR